MASATDVGITPTSSSSPIEVAVVQDAATNMHQRMVVETWDGTDDPLPVSAAAPMPVSIIAGAIPAGTDGGGFTTGTTQGIPVLAAVDDNPTPLAQGVEAIPRISPTRQLQVAVGASSTDGWTTVEANSGSATPVPAQLKGAAGKLGVLSLTNSGSGWAYLKIWDAGSSSPTIGTTAPNQNYGIPPNGGNNPVLNGGLQFNNGIWYAITGGAAKLDATAVATDQVQANFGYL